MMPTRSGHVPLPIACLLIAACLWPSQAEAQDTARGFDLFQNAVECASCHGAAAEGGSGPALAGTRLSLDAVRRQVRAPSSRRMPAFDEEELSEEGLRAIYAYLGDLEPPSLADKATWWNIDLLNLATPAMPARRDLEIHFTHRFSESVVDAGFEGLYGLDSFAFPTFWFSYGLHERVAPYVGRSANLATWEYGVKLGLLLEDQISLPLSIAANIGGTYLDADGVPNAGRFTVELPVGIRLGDRFALQAVPMYATNPDELGRSTEGYAAAIGFGGSVRINTRISLDGEYITHLGGFRRRDAVDQWQAGVTFHVRRHWFSLLFSNSAFTTPDFMVGGTQYTGIKSNVRFGFNLVRAFSF